MTTMSENVTLCPLCERELGSSEDYVKIGEKGAVGINKASTEIGRNVNVMSGRGMHESCRMKYVNKKDIQRYNTSNLNSQTTAKRSTRISTGMFDSKTDCFFCGNKFIINYKKPEENEYSCVSTFGFVDKIINHCKTRSDG